MNMNTEPNNGLTNSLTSKQHASILNSVRSDAKKIREAIDRMRQDATKLAGTPSGEALIEAVIVMSVGLRNVREIFKVDL